MVPAITAWQAEGQVWNHGGRSCYGFLRVETYGIIDKASHIEDVVEDSPHLIDRGCDIHARLPHQSPAPLRLVRHSIPQNHRTTMLLRLTSLQAVLQYLDRAYDDFYRRVALKLMMAVASSYPPSRGLPGRMSVASSFSAVPMAISYIFS